jgi:hypothetical protein
LRISPLASDKVQWSQFHALIRTSSSSGKYVRRTCCDTWSVCGQRDAASVQTRQVVQPLDSKILFMLRGHITNFQQTGSKAIDGSRSERGEAILSEHPSNWIPVDQPMAKYWFEVFTAVRTSRLVMWVVTPCVLLGDTNVSEEHTASIFRVLISTYEST